MAGEHLLALSLVGAADVGRFCREINHSHCKTMYDTFHANIEENDPAGALRKVGKKWLKHVHMCENDRGIPGSGRGRGRRARHLPGQLLHS